MSLTTHPYHFFSNVADFLDVWKKTLEKLSGDSVQRVLGVWDKMDGMWFDDAPMLLVLSSGVMSIHVKCEKDLAIGWNDILPIEKPIWFDEYQLNKEKNGLRWQEDLVWKDYEQARDSLGKAIAKITPISNDNGLIGIYIDFSDGEQLIFKDQGDVIAASFISAKCE